MIYYLGFSVSKELLVGYDQHVDCMPSRQYPFGFLRLMDL